jgi:Flp pilus assembly protein TadG
VARWQRGQAIVLIAVILVVLFGFLGLAVDGGRGYLDRRQLQASVDAAALAAAYDYMNNRDYAHAELAATNEFAQDQRLYVAPSCSGYGGTLVSCSFNDPTSQTLSLSVSDHSIAGVTFTATTSHRIPVTIMQVLGSGSTIGIGATATAVARQQGTNGAAIETLSPGGCSGTGANSLTFQGTAQTTVVGDVWSNGSIFDNSNSNGGSVTGNVVGICPSTPFLTTPTPWSVSGTQAIGFNIPDPNFAQPPINSTARAWSAASGSVELPGTYAANPSISGQHPCYFLAPGVYTFAAGLTDNAGFMSNELRPPDEPELTPAGSPNTTSLSADLSGTNLTSIAVTAVPAPIPAGSAIAVGGSQVFTSSAAVGAGATSIPISKQSASGTIPSGTLVSVRALPQFWDSNGVGCSGTFSLSNPGSSTNLSGTWSGEITAVRWESTGGSSCSGPATGTCYERESAPSMCKSVSLGGGGNIQVSVSSANSATGDPGAQSFNLYLAQNGTCSGLAYATSFSNGSNASTNVNNSTLPAGWPAGQPGPPDQEGLPVAAGLPNTDTAAGNPPSGDRADERQCVETTLGGQVACPSAWTPGAVIFYIPSGGCLDTHGGQADIYLFSGYQYSRVLIYEPGPEQSGLPNTCQNYINGNGFTSLIGIVYTPAASVQLNGNTTYQATIAGGVIAWTATVTGNGGVSITADPSLRTWPTAVRLIQ